VVAGAIAAQSTVGLSCWRRAGWDGALRHQLEGIFIGESGLLRLAEPGGAERLEAGQILGGERNPGQGRGGEERRSRVSVSS